MIILNLKTYQKSLEKALYFTDIVSEVVEETGLRIVICPPSIHLKDAAERYSEVFAQHCDPSIPGAYTGSLSAEALKIIKVKGSLLNHSEKKLDIRTIKETLERIHGSTLESLVCASSIEEIEKIAVFSPTYIAIEPPELIGSGISVSDAKPELVSTSVKKIKTTNPKIVALCGAGITSKNDLKKALQLESEGVLLSSAFVNAKDPKEFLKELASVF